MIQRPMRDSPAEDAIHDNQKALGFKLGRLEEEICEKVADLYDEALVHGMSQKTDRFVGDLLMLAADRKATLAALEDALHAQAP